MTQRTGQQEPKTYRGSPCLPCCPVLLSGKGAVMRNGFDRAEWTLIAKGLKALRSQTERLVREDRRGNEQLKSLSSEQRQELKAKGKRCSALIDRVQAIIVKL